MQRERRYNKERKRKHLKEKEREGGGVDIRALNKGIKDSYVN